MAETPLLPPSEHQHHTKHQNHQMTPTWMIIQPLLFRQCRPLNPLPPLQGNLLLPAPPDPQFLFPEAWKTQIWERTHVLSTLKMHSKLCKTTLWLFKNAILRMLKSWKARLPPSPLKFRHLKNNYYNTKQPHQHNVPPYLLHHNNKPGPRKLPEQSQSNPLPPHQTKSLPLLF